MIRPIVCPPITFLGLAVSILGIAKIIKAVAPIDAMMTAFFRLMLDRSAIAVFKEKPLIANPNAVAAAGGCSVSITTIIKIANPTAREYESAA